MTGLLDKIKGKLVGNWSSLFAVTSTPPALIKLNHRTLYDLFYLPQLVGVDSMTKENILIGAQKINDILAYTLSSSSFDDMQFRMAFYDIYHAIEEWDEADPLTLDNATLAKLHQNRDIPLQIISRLEQKINNRAGLFEWSDKDIHAAIKLAAHFSDRLHSLLQKSGIAAQLPLLPPGDYIAPFPKSLPPHKLWLFERE
jgi:hypothetical protein